MILALKRQEVHCRCENSLLYLHSKFWASQSYIVRLFLKKPHEKWLGR